MPFTIVRQDITKMRVDAIVNAANTALRMGGGVCGAIFRAAGPRELQAACDRVAPIKTGGAAITPGFALPAKYVIHAAGPIYSQWSPEKSAALLRSAYLSALRLAEENGCESIAFPLISGGIYGYPKAEALRVATASIQEFLSEHEMDIYLAVFDREAFGASRALMGRVASYIDEHYVETHSPARPRGNLPELEAEESCEFCLNAAALRPAAPQMAAAPSAEKSLAQMISQMDESFSETLLRLIDEKGKTDVEVYKKANIDRKLFSKIRSVKGYTPKKATILALAIGLELTLPETETLLRRAGYALSHASKFDVIVEYFILQRQYNIFDINEVLFQYDQPLLGGT